MLPMYVFCCPLCSDGGGAQCQATLYGGFSVRSHSHDLHCFEQSQLIPGNILRGGPAQDGLHHQLQHVSLPPDLTLQNSESFSPPNKKHMRSSLNRPVNRHYTCFNIQSVVGKLFNSSIYKASYCTYFGSNVQHLQHNSCWIPLFGRGSSKRYASIDTL